MQYQKLAECLSFLSMGLLECAIQRRHHGTTAAQFWKWLRERDRLPADGKALKQALQDLECLGLLAVSRPARSYHPTWRALQVFNYYQQALWADPWLPVAEPGREENGDSPAGAACQDYRPLAFRPGYCWCGHHEAAHSGDLLAGEGSGIAAEAAARAPGEGARCYETLLVNLPILHNRILRVLSIAWTQSSAHLARLIGHSVETVEAALEQLCSLDLVEQNRDKWSLSWDGQGLVNWANHLLCGGDPNSHPAAGENGSTVSPGPCLQFRLFAGTLDGCWCGRLRSEHASEAVRIAEQYCRQGNSAGD